MTETTITTRAWMFIGDDRMLFLGNGRAEPAVVGRTYYVDYREGDDHDVFADRPDTAYVDPWMRGSREGTVACWVEVEGVEVSGPGDPPQDRKISPRRLTVLYVGGVEPDLWAIADRAVERAAAIAGIPRVDVRDATAIGDLESMSRSDRQSDRVMASLAEAESYLSRAGMPLRYIVGKAEDAVAIAALTDARRYITADGADAVTEDGDDAVGAARDDFRAVVRRDMDETLTRARTGDRPPKSPRPIKTHAWVFLDEKGRLPVGGDRYETVEVGRVYTVDHTDGWLEMSEVIAVTTPWDGVSGHPVACWVEVEGVEVLPNRFTPPRGVVVSPRRLTVLWVGDVEHLICIASIAVIERAIELTDVRRRDVRRAVVAANSYAHRMDPDNRAAMRRAAEDLRWADELEARTPLEYVAAAAAALCDRPCAIRHVTRLAVEAVAHATIGDRRDKDRARRTFDAAAAKDLDAAMAQAIAE